MKRARFVDRVQWALATAAGPAIRLMTLDLTGAPDGPFSPDVLAHHVLTPGEQLEIHLSVTYPSIGFFHSTIDLVRPG